VSSYEEIESLLSAHVSGQRGLLAISRSLLRHAAVNLADHDRAHTVTMMRPNQKELDKISEKLLRQKAEFEKRVNRIHEHARDPLESDSAEQAAQLGNVAVVAALEREAVHQIADIDAALERIVSGTYGICVTCGDCISKQRLEARPASTACLDCAEATQSG
jgi:DnaK suppressor protein